MITGTPGGDGGPNCLRQVNTSTIICYTDAGRSGSGPRFPSLYGRSFVVDFGGDTCARPVIGQSPGCGAWERLGVGAFVTCWRVLWDLSAGSRSREGWEILRRCKRWGMEARDGWRKRREADHLESKGRAEWAKSAGECDVSVNKAARRMGDRTLSSAHRVYPA
jgi:hypothetical protein